METYTVKAESGRHLHAGPEEQAYLYRVDQVKKQGIWGRLSIRGSFGRDSILTVYASAGADGSREPDFFEQGKGPFVNRYDILLYGLKGRYLWIYLKISGQGSSRVEELRITNPGDNFLQTFPELFQEQGGFFHRYLSVLSSMYADFQEKLDHMEELFDPLTAPTEMLPKLADWMGIDCGSALLQERQIRRLLKECHALIRIRGTRLVLIRLTRLLLGEEPVVIEKENRNVTLLVGRELPQEEEWKLLFFLNQFKPADSRLNIVSFQEAMGMDEYCFLDRNAELKAVQPGVLDEDAALEKNMIS